jgi:hypothetical protein
VIFRRLLAHLPPCVLRLLGLVALEVPARKARIRAH